MGDTYYSITDDAIIDGMNGPPREKYCPLFRTLIFYLENVTNPTPIHQILDRYEKFLLPGSGGEFMIRKTRHNENKQGRGYLSILSISRK